METKYYDPEGLADFSMVPWRSWYENSSGLFPSLLHVSLLEEFIL